MPLYILHNIKVITRPFLRKTVNRRQVEYIESPQFGKVSIVQKSTTTPNDRKYEGWLTWKATIKSFVPIGICLIAVMQWRSYRKQMKERLANKFEINCYRILPLRMVSRWWGWFADKNLPLFLRPYIYGMYINTFGVNLSEAATQDLTAYKNLSDFFARPLKEGARMIDQSSPIISPCDGTVLHFGTVHTGHVEQVKGVTYSLENFLGENTWNKNGKSQQDYRSSLLHKLEHNHTLYQCVIYLAPGDYHRFHSPAEWRPTHRRHFHGELLSVSPGIAQWLPGLFCINERAVYLGEWEYGFFSYTAVGATNVGTIKVYFDKNLQTNRPRTHYQKDKYIGSNIALKKGDPFGEFRMGSTIVLVFEAPSDFQFTLKCGQKLKMGQSIGYMSKESFTSKVQTINNVKSKNIT